MIRTYTDDIKELLKSGIVKIVKVKLFSVRYGEDEELAIDDFLDNFEIFSQSGIFSNSVIWSFDNNTENLTLECDLYIRGEIDGEEEVLLYIKLEEKETSQTTNEILLKWLREKELNYGRK